MNFNHPFTLMVAGPTSSGKTEFVKKLLCHARRMIVPPPEKITWHYGTWQNWYVNFGHCVEFQEGLPNAESLDTSTRKIIVIDDLMDALDLDVEKLFTKFSHHKNASVIYLTQNIFNKGAHQRNISLNSHYIVAMRNLRDKRQISHLGQQAFPGQAKFFKSAYEDATKRKYGYLLFEFTSDGTDARLLTDIFPDEHEFPAVYVKQ